MTALTLQNELGDNTDLLVRPDQWLENHHRDLASKVSIMLEELENVQKAQRFKRQLQQRNQVAVLLSERDEHGNEREVAIKIMSLPDAMKLINKPEDDQDRANLNAQLYTWDRDGYDLDTSARLRTS